MYNCTFVLGNNDKLQAACFVVFNIVPGLLS